ncbi:MAG TPA: hypothetical protein ENN28_01615 [Candidatus Uhrbacteria bacterium]|nr:hypothetical protein [Candidatus Uhrbacteria bacterium]
MTIKFQDKFESILYAVLYNNLTGYFLHPKNKPDNLFAGETFIDIDKLNWQEILECHNDKYGKINWLDYNEPDFLLFKNRIKNLLKLKNKNKYQLSINLIRLALKFGPAYVLRQGTKIEVEN